MIKDDSLVEFLIAGGLGYLLAKGQDSEWQPVIDNYKKRLEHIQYFKIPPPWGYLDKNQNMKVIYRESILCYLFGLSNSCIPSLMRVLEQSLIEKYKRVENKKPSDEMSLKSLIDWAEKILKDKTQVAHSFRILRNYIHTDTLVQEQDAIEGIRHISIIVHNLFPSDCRALNTKCPGCGRMQVNTIPPNIGFLGNTLSIRCSCGRNYKWILLS
jgi:hypothetical protein